MCLSGSTSFHIPSTECLSAAIPVAGEGLLFGMGSLVSLHMLNTSTLKVSKAKEFPWRVRGHSPKPFTAELAGQSLGFELTILAGVGSSQCGMNTFARVRGCPSERHDGEHPRAAGTRQGDWRQRGEGRSEETAKLDRS